MIRLRPPGFLFRKQRGYKAFMHVFADDSSSFGKEGFTCLAGVIARDSNWNSFADDWDALLGKHKMPRLHTSDFLSNQQGYERLNLSYEQRVVVLQEFMAVARRHIECVILVGMNASDYREALKEYAKKYSPSDFLFLRFLRFAHRQMEDWGYQEPISFIFDDNHKTSPRLYSSWSNLKRKNKLARNSMAGITFADDGLMPPLQAADLVACGLTRSQRAGKLMWGDESEFQPLFVDAAGPYMAMPIRQEFWDAETFTTDKAKALREAVEGLRQEK